MDIRRFWVAAFFSAALVPAAGCQLWRGGFEPLDPFEPNAGDGVGDFDGLGGDASGGDDGGIDPNLSGLHPDCLAIYESGYSTVEGTVNNTFDSPGPNLAQGVRFAMEDYNTCVARLTAPGADYATATYLRNDHARRQAFNADSSLFLVNASDDTWHIYQSQGGYVKILPDIPAEADVHWHPTDPDLVYYFSNLWGLGMEWIEENVVTGNSTLVHDFSDVVQAIWPTAAGLRSGSVGAPSRDNRYWSLLVIEPYDGSLYPQLGVVVLDTTLGAVASSYDFALNGKSGASYTSMSASGDFVIIEYSQADGAVQAYDRDFSNPRQVNPIPKLSDLGLLANGHDAYISWDQSSGDIFFYDLNDDTRTDLAPLYNMSGATSAMNISAKSVDMPGWALISTFAGDRPNGPVWYHDKIFAFELVDGGRIVQLAHTAIEYNGEQSHPEAVANHDFTRILYNSNWLTGSSTDIYGYLIELPADFLR